MMEIPANALTLYADLDQAPAFEVEPATISRRIEGGQRRLYASMREGVRLRQVYLGTEGSHEAEAKAEAHRQAMAAARQRRKTVSALKRLGIPAPPLAVGRILDALARAGIFEAGGVLAGTGAYQCYPCVVGHILPAASLMTRDVDLSLARVVVPRLSRLQRPLDDILREADPTFAAVMRGEKAPQSFRNGAGFMVDLLTTPGRRPGPVLIRGLGAYATPLPFMDFLIDEPIRATALYGRGVAVMVPQPARFAIHKMVIARRRVAQKQKAPKDLMQANALIEALKSFDPDGLDDALHVARQRGGDLKSVATAIAARTA